MLDTSASEGSQGASQGALEVSSSSVPFLRKESIWGLMKKQSVNSTQSSSDQRLKTLKQMSVGEEVHSTECIKLSQPGRQVKKRNSYFQKLADAAEDAP